MSARPRRRGMAMILALLLLVVAVSLSAAFITVSQLELVASDTLAQVHGARLEAEGGLSFMIYVLRQKQYDNIGTGQAMLDNVAAALGEAMNGTGNLSGQQVLYDGTTITVPAISSGQSGRHFTATLSLQDAETLLMQVTGYNGTLHRSLGVSVGVQIGESQYSMFDFGIASKGPIVMTGNAKVLGANTAKEAEILSAVYEVCDAVDLTGNTEIQGDVYASDPDTKVKLNGNIQVGGERIIGNVTLPDPDVTDAIVDHVHIGIGEVDFPEVAPTQFESYATNIVDSSTNTSGNQTFENIRIKAGVNPTFSGNTTIKGVVYIEMPNKIHFSGNVTLTGVIVTEDAGDDAYADNTIKFSGNLVARGVEELPDMYPFRELRTKTGSFILAPGFSVEFVGNFGTIGGGMAADQFKWTGNASGTIKGSLISYSTAEFKMVGNSTITFDRDGLTGQPAGFGGPAAKATLVLIMDTYTEY